MVGSLGACATPLPSSCSLCIAHTSGAAYDSDGRLLVSVPYLNRIMCFDINGKWLSNFGEGVLRNPHGLCTDEVDNFFVADTGELQLVPGTMRL